MILSLDYIAAYIDADGSIGIVNAKTRHGDRHYYGRLGVYSQNISVLESIKEVIGGRIRPASMVFALQLSPKEVVNALKSLAPILRVKREQAYLVLELHRHIEEHRYRRHPGKTGGAFHAEEIWEYREELYQRMKALNKFDSQEFRKNRVNSVDAPEGAIPSQAAEGEVGSAEGVTTRGPSPNGNDPQECPARADNKAKGRDSLSSTILM